MKWVKSCFFPALELGASIDLSQATWMLFPRILNLKAVKQVQEQPLKAHDHSGHSGMLTMWPALPDPTESPELVPIS